MRALALATALATAFAAAFPVAVLAGSETSLRCPGGVVGLGDATIDLLGKCGPPALREVSAEGGYAPVNAAATPFGTITVSGSERWTYDFGSSQFVMFATVDGGKVVTLDRGGYGRERGGEPAPLPRATCDTSAIKIGTSRVDLVGRCGQPVLVELRMESAVYEVPADLRGSVFLSMGPLRQVEVWTYDFGPQSFVRFAVLDGDVVVRVDTGDHGYAR